MPQVYNTSSNQRKLFKKKRSHSFFPRFSLLMSVVLGLNLKKKPPPYAKVCGWLYNKGLVMPQVYNTTSTKASRKNEKRSALEFECLHEKFRTRKDP
jgi:hypothetical protein